MASVVDVQKSEFSPENETSSGAFSFGSGSPVVQFHLAGTSQLLRTASLRFNGRLTVKAKVGGAQPANDGTVGVGAHLNSKIGAHSIIENLTITNSAGVVLESVRQYNRLVSAIHGATMALNDSQSTSLDTLCDGLDATSSMLLNTVKVPFSLRLHAGMLMGTAIPLDKIGGLKVSMELSPSSNVLHGTNAGNFEYVIEDCSLTADMLTVDAGRSGLPDTGSFGFKAWSSLYSTIQSGDANLTFAIPNRAVQSISHSFSKATDQNNPVVDSMALNTLQTATGDAALRKVDFSKNGIKVATDYSLDVETQSSQKLPETQALVQGLRVFQGPNANHFALTPESIGFGEEPAPPFTPGNFLPTTRDDSKQFLLGINLDKMSSVGQAFDGQPYSVRLRSGLQGDQSNAVHTHILSAAAIQYGPQGIQVVS